MGFRRCCWGKCLSDLGWNSSSKTKQRIQWRAACFTQANDYCKLVRERERKKELRAYTLICVC